VLNVVEVDNITNNVKHAVDEPEDIVNEVAVVDETLVIADEPYLLEIHWVVC
jgi:hypothetical protein